jgi:hypothetical protein
MSESTGPVNPRIPSINKLKWNHENVDDILVRGGNHLVLNDRDSMAFIRALDTLDEAAGRSMRLQLNKADALARQRMGPGHHSFLNFKKYIPIPSIPAPVTPVLLSEGERGIRAHTSLGVVHKCALSQMAHTPVRPHTRTSPVPSTGMRSILWGNGSCNAPGTKGEGTAVGGVTSDNRPTTSSSGVVTPKSSSFETAAPPPVLPKDWVLGLRGGTSRSGHDRRLRSVSPRLPSAQRPSTGPAQVVATAQPARPVPPPENTARRAARGEQGRRQCASHTVRSSSSSSRGGVGEEEVCPAEAVAAAAQGSVSLVKGGDWRQTESPHRNPGVPGSAAKQGTVVKEWRKRTHNYRLGNKRKTWYIHLVQCADCVSVSLGSVVSVYMKR